MEGWNGLEKRDTILFIFLGLPLQVHISVMIQRVEKQLCCHSYGEETSFAIFSLSLESIMWYPVYTAD